MLPLSKIKPGYYVARVKDVPSSEFLCVCWGISPFLQCYSISGNDDLSDRPSFQDVRIQDCEFVVRLPSPTELTNDLTPEE